MTVRVSPYAAARVALNGVAIAGGAIVVLSMTSSAFLSFPAAALVACVALAAFEKARQIIDYADPKTVNAMHLDLYGRFLALRSLRDAGFSVEKRIAALFDEMRALPGEMRYRDMVAFESKLAVPFAEEVDTLSIDCLLEKYDPETLDITEAQKMFLLEAERRLSELKAEGRSKLEEHEIQKYEKTMVLPRARMETKKRAARRAYRAHASHQQIDSQIRLLGKALAALVVQEKRDLERVDEKNEKVRRALGLQEQAPELRDLTDPTSTQKRYATNRRETIERFLIPIRRAFAAKEEAVAIYQATVNAAEVEFEAAVEEAQSMCRELENTWMKSYRDLVEEFTTTFRRLYREERAAPALALPETE